MISSASQVLVMCNLIICVIMFTMPIFLSLKDLQNAPAPTVSVVPATTAQVCANQMSAIGHLLFLHSQDPLASSPVSASSPTPLQVCLSFSNLCMNNST